MAKQSLEEMAASELVQYHLAQSLDFAAAQLKVERHEWINSNFTDTSRLNGGPFGSPLEMVFWAWFFGIQQHHRFWLHRQFEVNGGQFRADFAVTDGTPPGLLRPLLLVEVDGHAFHERTPEQVASRDSRDRALMSCGYKVFHFSFRELTTRPVDCAYEVLMAARLEQESRGAS